MADLLQRQIDVATRVCEGWHEFSEADFRECFTDDVGYHNMPVADVVRGPGKMYETLRPVQQAFDIRLKIDTLVAKPDVVVVERTEVFTPRDGSRPSFELPCNGVFEFEGARIKEWRDYFDMRTFQGE